MELYFFMCSKYRGAKDVTRLAEIMKGNDLVLAWKRSETPDGKLGPIPYWGKTSTFVEDAYRGNEFVNSHEIVNSSGPYFGFEVITRLKYPEPDVPRFDYITLSCGGHMLGRSYNFVSVLIDFHTPEAPDIESPYFEEGAQLMLKVGIELYTYLRPWYGWLDHSQHDFISFEAIRDRKELDTIYWANFYGPQYVEKYGPNLFLDSPAWKKEKLPDSGIYLQLSEFYTKPASGEEKLKLKDHFSPHGLALSHGNPYDEDYQEPVY